MYKAILSISSEFSRFYSVYVYYYTVSMWNNTRQVKITLSLIHLFKHQS